MSAVCKEASLKTGTQPVLWRRGHNLSSEDKDATCPLKTGIQPVLWRWGHNLSSENRDTTCPLNTGTQPFLWRWGHNLSSEDKDATCPLKTGTQPVIWRRGHNLSSEDGDATCPQNVVHCISIHVIEKVRKIYEFRLYSYFLATWHISLQSCSCCGYSLILLNSMMHVATQL